MYTFANITKKKMKKERGKKKSLYELHVHEHEKRKVLCPLLKIVLHTYIYICSCLTLPTVEAITEYILFLS